MAERLNLSHMSNCTLAFFYLTCNIHKYVSMYFAIYEVILLYEIT